MPRKRYTPEEVIQYLRTVELDTVKGLAVLDACRKLGITEQVPGGGAQWGIVLYAPRSTGARGALAARLQYATTA